MAAVWVMGVEWQYAVHSLLGGWEVEKEVEREEEEDGTGRGGIVSLRSPFSLSLSLSPTPPVFSTLAFLSSFLLPSKTRG